MAMYCVFGIIISLTFQNKTIVSVGFQGNVLHKSVSSNKTCFHDIGSLCLQLGLVHTHFNNILYVSDILALLSFIGAAAFSTRCFKNREETYFHYLN